MSRSYLILLDDVLDVGEDKSDELNESDDERPECSSSEMIPEESPEGREDSVDTDTSLVSGELKMKKDSFELVPT